MTQNTLAVDGATDSVGAETPEVQVTGKTYTEQEFNDAMAKLKSSVAKKVLKPYEDLGDPETLRQLKQEAEAKALEVQKSKGEFDTILKDMASKKDAEIQKRDALIAEFKVDVPLTNAAAKYRSVNPEQVKALLKSNVRMTPEGEVEVVDSKGVARYKDSGEHFGVDDLVREFLDLNPHFVQPTPATTNSRNSISGLGNGDLDITKLDLTKQEDRKVYAEWRKTQYSGVRKYQ